MSPRGLERKVKPFIAAALIWLLAAGPCAFAQDRPDVLDNLESVEEELENRKSERDAANAKADQLKAEERELKRQMIDAAQQVQQSEAMLTDAEFELIGLLVQQNTLIVELLDRNKTLSTLLGALESLELNRPPALAVDPSDAVKAARSAMLLSILVPKLQEEAQKLDKSLERLSTLRSTVEEQRSSARAATKDLDDRRQHLEDLLRDLSARRRVAQNEAESETRRLASLAAEARDLKSLLSKLDRPAAIISPRLRPAPPSEHEVGEAPPQEGEDKPETAQFQQAYLGVKPKSFNESRGAIRMPVAGFPTQHFGAEDESGGRTKGMKFTTRESAQVVAPFDGSIAFAGEFLGYGQLLIIEAGGGYHILLAGMTRIDGIVGQQLLAGEPVGMMGVSGGAGESGSATELYVEFRKDGEPFNPAPWLSTSTTKANL